jgi:hypothetical protein
VLRFGLIVILAGLVGCTTPTLPTHRWDGRPIDTAIIERDLALGTPELLIVRREQESAGTRGESTYLTFPFISRREQRVEYEAVFLDVLGRTLFVSDVVLRDESDRPRSQWSENAVGRAEVMIDPDRVVEVRRVIYRDRS